MGRHPTATDALQFDVRAAILRRGPKRRQAKSLCENVKHFRIGAEKSNETVTCVRSQSDLAGMRCDSATPITITHLFPSEAPIAGLDARAELDEVLALLLV